jgi:nucleoside-diphosphate-sugar epimerase
MLEHRNASPQHPERVVLLGGGGFLGRTLAARLRTAGIATLAPSSAELDLAGIGAQTALKALLRPGDSLVVLSALTPDRGRGLNTFMANLRMIENLCAVLVEAAPAQVVYFSSDAVYPLGAGLVDEDSPAAPADLYGVMHRSRELMLTQVLGGELCILRPTLVYGPGDSHNSYGPNRFRRQAASAGRITLGGAGEETRDHIHVQDVAELTLRVLTRRSRGILNLATGRAASFMTVARMVAERFEPAAEVVCTPRTGPISHRAFDVTALHRAFPGFVGTSLEQGLALIPGDQ